MAHHESDQETPHIIPIGVTCSVAYYFKTIGQRREALPFDWNVNSVRHALDLILFDFQGFLEEPNLAFLPPANRNLFDQEGGMITLEEQTTPVIDRKTGILFVHDFPVSGREALEEVKEKYSRRIERLRQRLDSGHPVRMIYHLVPLNEWQREQYHLAEYEFIDESEDDLQDDFARIRAKYPNVSFQSLPAFWSPPPPPQTPWARLRRNIRRLMKAVGSIAKDRH